MTDQPNFPVSRELSSVDVATYVDQAAALMGLPIPPTYRQSVIDNFARIATIAPLVMDFPLPEDIEVAPIFVPEP